MEELQELIKFLKAKGFTNTKIDVDLLCGIIEYFGSKQQTKQCIIADVSNRRELLIDFCSKAEDKACEYKFLIPNTDFVDEYLKGN